MSSRALVAVDPGEGKRTLRYFVQHLCNGERDIRNRLGPLRPELV